jgi:DNA polymerase
MPAGPCGDAEPQAAVPVAGGLDALKRAVEAEFPFCESLAGATACVFGEGDPTADLVFVGEAPGADEDRLGRPFVGAAGRKLDEIIKAMGLERDEVYICNVLKARPPGNRTPLPDEVAQATPWLYGQLRLIRPSVIVALGGPAAKLLLQTGQGITRLRGRMGVWQDPDSDLSIPVMPTFHPAYLLRNYTPEVRGQVWQDMQAVMGVMGRD